LCATIVHSAMHTHMNRPNRSLDWVLSHWAHFTVLRFIFVYVLLGHIAVLRKQMRPILTDRVAWSVSLSVTLVSPAKTAAPIELPFELRIWVGPGSHVLDGVQIPHGKRQILGGEWASHCKV